MNLRYFIKYKSGLQPYIWRLKNWLGFYAKHIPRKYSSVMASLGPKDVVLDLGANVGFYTSLFAWSGAKVYAFEPDPRALSVLSKNCEKYQNVVIKGVAVGSASGTEKLYFHNEDQGDVNFSESSTIIKGKKNSSSGKGVEVEILGIRDLILSFPERVSLIKMDIEGAELYVLPILLEKEILSKIGVIWVETHESQFPSKASEFLALRDLIEKKGEGKFDLSWH